MPEYREDNQYDEYHGRTAMIIHGIFITEKLKRAVDFKAGNDKNDYQRRLHPVPETFKCFIYVYLFHVIPLISFYYAQQSESPRE